MTNYQENSIWKRTLAQQHKSDKLSEERGFLRVEFKNIRKKAKQLAGEIALVLPEFTVHDISHSDALWDMAEIILPKDFDINPVEVFVLGCAFLFHDLGMALAAYPKGVEELKKEQIWQDSVAALRKEFSNKSNTNVMMDEKDIEKRATEKTLRSLHAKRAKDLAKVSWKNSNNQETFLIDNEEIRCSFGDIIGLIAYSHWLKVDELEEKLPPTLGALSRFPSDWTIDPIKLACILRLADAMQLDDRRAPPFLKSIRNLPPLSEKHWRFQENLCKSIIKDNRIAYTSKSPFSIDWIDAWWECFDMLKMLDYEIKQVDALLTRPRNISLGIFGVYSIDNIKELSKLIRVEGWEPVDAKIRVDDVAKLVSDVGGVKLYGKDSIVPLRELIQNSSDAIRARKIIDNEASSYGDIYIRIDKDEEGDYLEVEDNGIGMSEKVLIGPFLDFGQTFWGTDLMHEELPGLESKGFKSTRKYGIGFFSLFMWGDKVSVFTNRYDKGRKDTLVLEFNKGFASRPILRKAKPKECIRNGGTKVKVWFKEPVIFAHTITFLSSAKSSEFSLSVIIENLFPSMDCNIWIKDRDNFKKVITANDWVTMPVDKFLKRLLGGERYNSFKMYNKDYYDIVAENLAIIKDKNHTVVGRAALLHDIDFDPEGIVTVGGFRTSNLRGLIGIFVGESEKISRDTGIPIIQDKDLNCFVNNQITKFKKQKISNDDQVKIAKFCRKLTGQTGHLKIAKHKNIFVNYDEIREYVSSQKYDNYVLVNKESINNYEMNNLTKIVCNDNVFLMLLDGLISRPILPYNLQWPTKNVYAYSGDKGIKLKGRVIEAISEAWDCKIDDLYESSSFSSNNTDFSEYIGTSNNKKVLMKHIDIIRRPQKA